MSKKEKEEKKAAKKAEKKAEDQRLAAIEPVQEPEATPLPDLPENVPSGDSIAEYSAAALAALRRRKKTRRIIRRLVIWILVLAVVGFAVWLWVQKTRAEYQTEYDPYTATTGTITNSLSYSGALQLVNSQIYTADADTKVSHVYVSRGDRVTAGDNLVRLRNGQTCKAEFDGTVNTVSVAVGDSVSAGDELIKVVDFDHMRVSIRINAANIGEVQEGTRCRITVSTAGVTVDGQIGEIDFSTYSGNNTVYYNSTVDVNLTGTQGVYPGMAATVIVPQREAADVVILRSEAISTAADNTAFVYKLREDGTITESPITLGVSNGTYTEIKEGVEDGETVYAVVKKDESTTGWAAILQSTFGSQRVNQPAGFSPSNRTNPGNNFTRNRTNGN